MALLIPMGVSLLSFSMSMFMIGYKGGYLSRRYHKTFSALLLFTIVWSCTVSLD